MIFALSLNVIVSLVKVVMWDNWGVSRQSFATMNQTYLPTIYLVTVIEIYDWPGVTWWALLQRLLMLEFSVLSL